MEYWKCTKCGKCCTNQIQLELYKNEIDDFPKNRIIPYMGIGDTKDTIEIILFKLIGKRCPLYDEKVGCTIYENRPSICQRFPMNSGGIDKTCTSCPKDGKMIAVYPKDREMVSIGNYVYKEVAEGYKNSKIWLYKKFKWRHQSEEKLRKMIK